MHRTLILALLVVGLFINVAYSQGPPTHNVLIYYNPLTQADWPGPGIMANDRGNFLPDWGWQTENNNGQLMITLPEDLPFEGTFEIEVTNFDPHVQSWDDKHQIINLYSRPEASKRIYDTDAAWWNFRTGQNYDGTRAAGDFKFLSHPRHVDSRVESRIYTGNTWNENKVYKFSVVWTREWIWILKDGKNLKKHAYQGQVEPFRYCFLGTDNVYNTMPGPIYRNLKIFTSEAEGVSPGVEVVSGNNQNGNPGAPLPEPLTVRAFNSKSEGFGSVPVYFQVQGGGGQILEEQPIVTDSTGLASATWLVGSGAGEQSVIAYGAGLPGDSATFVATSLVAHAVQKIKGDGQSGRVAASLSDSVIVRVVGQTENPVEGWPVTFEITQGQGSINDQGVGPIEVNTDALGFARAEWSLGQVAGMNNNVLQARALALGQDLAGSPIIFTASAMPGADTVIVKVSGDEQIGVVGTVLDLPLVIRTEDQFSNIHAGVDVDFKVSEGGGDLVAVATDLSARVTTDTSGLATINWTMGPIAGAQSVIAKLVYGNQDSVNFSATALPGSVEASNSTVTATTPVAADGIAQSTLTAVLKDQYGNSIQGAEVVFYSSGQDNEIDQPLNPTDATGTALGYLRSTKAEDKNVWAKVDGMLASEDSAFVRFVPGPANELVMISGDNQTGVVDSPLPDSIIVGVTDANENPIAGYIVEFVITEGGGSLSSNQAVTNAEGRAAVVWTLGEALGPNKLEARTTGLVGSPINFTATATVGAIDANNSTLTASTPVVADGSGQSTLTLILRDSFGNGIPGRTVMFVVSGNNNDITQPTNPTDGNGTAVGYLRSTVAEIKQVRAKVDDEFAPIDSVAVQFVAGPADKIAKVSGDNQSGFVDRPLADPLVIFISDAHSNPIQNFSVEFEITAGGGNLSVNQVLTGQDGKASADWTLGVAPGVNTVEVRAPALTGSPVVFTATGVLGSPHSIALISGNEQQGMPGSELAEPLNVQVKDDQDQGLAGMPIYFQARKGSFRFLSQPPIYTNQEGQAFIEVKLDTIAGVNEAAVWTIGLQDTIWFEFETIVGNEKHLRLVSGDGQEGRPFQALPNPLRVRITDQYHNSIVGFPVTFAASSGGGMINEPQPIFTDADGFAQCHWVLGVTGDQVVVATAEAIGSPLAFMAKAVNAAPTISAPTDTSVAAEQPLLFIVNVNDPDDDQVMVKTSGLPAGAVFDSVSTRAFAWMPKRDQVGQYVIQFFAEDVFGATSQTTTLITVLPGQNRRPTLLSFSPTQTHMTADTYSVIEFSVTAIDPDGDMLVYTWFVNNGVAGDQTTLSLYLSENLPSPTEVKVQISDGVNLITLSWVVEHMPSKVELSRFEIKEYDSQHVLLEWETESEFNNLGFYVYRAEGHISDFIKLTTEIIPSNADGKYIFFDETVIAGKTYRYQLEDIDQNGRITKYDPIEVEIPAPSDFALLQNYPNPFNPETVIAFQLPQSCQVRLSVYNVSGQVIRLLVNAPSAAGTHQVVWDGKNDNGLTVPSGVYYYRLEAENFLETKKLLFLR